MALEVGSGVAEMKYRFEDTNSKIIRGQEEGPGEGCLLTLGRIRNAQPSSESRHIKISVHARVCLFGIQRALG